MAWQGWRLWLALSVAAAVAVLVSSSAFATLPIGDQFRGSRTGPNGNEDFDAQFADVAYNSVEDRYLVVWSADNTVEDEFEIWGRLLDAAGDLWRGDRPDDLDLDAAGCKHVDVRAREHPAGVAAALGAHAVTTLGNIREHGNTLGIGEHVHLHQALPTP